MENKPVALVTGANKGIGLQIAKDLAAHGFTVLVGSRNLEHGETAAKSIGADAHPMQLDVTNQASVATAAERIRNEFGRLDVLVNNAGISHAENSGKSLEEFVKSGRATVASLDDVRTLFETNVFGVIAVTQAMLPLLREAPAARIVNVSSSSGSLTRNSDPTNPHRSMFGAYSWSKTALSAITLGFALDLESTSIKVNAACAGFTATDLNNFQVHGQSSRPHTSLCASHCSMRAVGQARSPTRMEVSHGDASRARDRSELAIEYPKSCTDTNVLASNHVRRKCYASCRRARCE